MTNLRPAHNATDPKCNCCKVVMEYNSRGYRIGLCISCTEATESFWAFRRDKLQKRGLIAK